MKIFALRPAWIMLSGLALALLTGGLASLAAPAFAQTPTEAPSRGGTDTLLTNPQGGDNAYTTDPFSQSGSNQMGSIMDLVQRAVSGGYTPTEDFNRQQSETINTEAADFRSRQLELLQQARPSAPTP